MSPLALFVVSVIAGGVGSMSGLGGGVVLLPVLTAHGIDIKHVIPVSIISTIAVSSGAASTYVRGHLTNLKVSAWLELFVVPGALLGASLAIIARPPLLSAICGIVLVLSAFLLARRDPSVWKPPRTVDVVSRTLQLGGSYYDQAERRTIAYAPARAWLGGPLMAVTGFIAGFLGIGGSAFSVLVQDVVMRLPPKVAVTTSNLIIGSMTVAGACVYLEAGLIDVQLAVPVILGVCVGAFAGSALLVRLLNRWIRRIFIIVILVLGLEMLLHLGRGF